LQISSFVKEDVAAITSKMDYDVAVLLVITSKMDYDVAVLLAVALKMGFEATVHCLQSRNWNTKLRESIRSVKTEIRSCGAAQVSPNLILRH